VKEIRWNPAKSEWLLAHRGLSFEALVQYPMLTTVEHHRRPHQQLMLFDREGYVWAAPCVEEDTYFFLKTAYPSRKYTQMHRRGLRL